MNKGRTAKLAVWGCVILLIASLAALSACKQKDGPEQAKEPEPATAQTAREDEKLPRDGAFVPETIFDRSYVVRIDGQRVGHALMQIEKWHHGLTLVTRFEEHWFPTPGKDRSHACWELQRHSETGKNAIAWWGNTQDRKRGANFRWGAGGTVVRNWLGEAGDPMKLATPKGHILFQRLAKLLSDTGQTPDSRLTTPVLNWHPMKPVWTQREFVCEGPDTIKDASGKPVSARRFRYSDSTHPDFHVLLWVDDQGYPLAKRVPFLKHEIVVADRAIADDHSQELAFDDAKKRWRLDDDGWILERLFETFASEAEPSATGATEKPVFPESLLIDFGL